MNPARVRPDPEEVPSFFAGYVARVPESDVLAAVEAQMETTAAFLENIPELRGDHRYAPGKWSIKEVVGHLADVERIMIYRALRFARADPTPLPGFDEDHYVSNAASSARRLTELVQEQRAIRQTSWLFFRHLPQEAWLRRGVANGATVSVRAFAFVILGHERHHLETLRQRYLMESKAS